MANTGRFSKTYNPRGKTTRSKYENMTPAQLLKLGVAELKKAFRQLREKIRKRVGALERAGYFSTSDAQANAKRLKNIPSLTPLSQQPYKDKQELVRMIMSQMSFLESGVSVSRLKEKKRLDREAGITEEDYDVDTLYDMIYHITKEEAYGIGSPEVQDFWETVKSSGIDPGLIYRNKVKIKELLKYWQRNKIRMKREQRHPDESQEAWEGFNEILNNF